MHPVSPSPSQGIVSVLPVSPYGMPLPSNLIQKIFNFVDLGMRERLSILNKSWYQLVKERPFLVRLIEFRGKQDQYRIYYNLNRKVSEKIFEQTGFEVPLPPGKRQIHDYIVGSGAFGTLRIGYALKKAHCVGIKITQGADATDAEIRIQEQLSELPFVMPSLDSYQATDAQGNQTFYQVMPLAGLGSAERLSYLLHNVDLTFREQLLFLIIEGFLTGLEALHQRDFVHLDLKPSNLVIDHRGYPLLIDFGCSKQVYQGILKHPEMEKGDANFFSYERWLRVFFPKPCDGKKVDAWAAGLTLLSLAHSNASSLFPYQQIYDYLIYAEKQRMSEETVAQQLQASFNKKKLAIPPLQSPAPDSLWAVIQGLLEIDPDQRLSISQALQKPWLAQMRQQSKLWEEQTRQKLCELVQSFQRETNTILQPSFAALSPQDLPHPHFSSYIEREELQKILEQRLLEIPTTPSTVTVCQGMGGTGKTQLVTYLLHSEPIKAHFGLRLWFQNADSKESLEMQHLILAREHRLVDERASAQEAIQKLHDYLASYQERTSKPWLIVYDNANNPALLKHYLPPEGGHVLMISRPSEGLEQWKDAVQIDTLTPSKAALLMAKLLQRPDPHINDLCKELGFLPLALVQASAYMRSNNLTALEYLTKLQQVPQLLKQDSRFFGKKLPASLFSIWEMSLKTLKQVCPEALPLLHAAAYLATDTIPHEALESLGSRKAVKAACQYGLLQKRDQHYSMPRLVQQVLRIQESDEEKAASLQHAFHAINRLYDFDPHTTSQLSFNQRLLPHGETLVAHCRSYSPLLPQLKEPVDRALNWIENLKKTVAIYGKGINDDQFTIDPNDNNARPIGKISGNAPTPVDLDVNGSYITDVTINIDKQDHIITENLSRIIEIDHSLRETVGLIIYATEAQLRIVQQLLDQPLEKRNFAFVSDALKAELRKIREHQFQDFEKVLEVTKTYIDQGHEIRLNQEKREQLKKQFALTLDQTLKQFEDEVEIGPATDLGHLKMVLEGRLTTHQSIYQQMLESRTLLNEEVFRLIQDRNELAQFRQRLRSREVTDIWIAIRVGALDYLLQKIKQLHFWKVKEFVNQKNSEGATLLHEACKYAQPQIVQLLLKNKADPNLRDEEGYLPIHWAAKRGSIESVKELLRYKISVEARGAYGRTPLHMAVFNSQYEMVDFLLKNGANINAQTDREDHLKTPLHDAVIHLDELMVSILMKSKSLDVNIRDIDNHTPLYHAVFDSCYNIIMMIAGHGSWRNPADPQDPNHIHQLLQLKLRRDAEKIKRFLTVFSAYQSKR